MYAEFLEDETNLFQRWIPKCVPKRVEDQNFSAFTNNNGRHFGYVARDERNEPNQIIRRFACLFSREARNEKKNQ